MFTHRQPFIQMVDPSNCTLFFFFFLVCLIACLLCADKDEFTQFYFLRKKPNTWNWNYPTDFLTLKATFFVFCFPCPLLFQLLPFFGCLLKRDRNCWCLGRRWGKSETSATWARDHVTNASSSPVLPPPSVLPVETIIRLQPLWASLRQHSLSC